MNKNAKNAETGVISVPQAKLLEIAQKVASFSLSVSEGSLGPVLNIGIFRHFFSIFKTSMQPEFACLQSLEGNPNAPQIAIRDNPEQAFSVGALLEAS